MPTENFSFEKRRKEQAKKAKKEAKKQRKLEAGTPPTDQGIASKTDGEVT